MKKNKIAVFILLIISISFSYCCKPPGTAMVNLTVKANYQGEPFALFKDFNLIGTSTKFRFTNNFHFYTTNIHFLREDNTSSSRLKEADLVDFGSSNYHTIKIDKIPNGNYKAIILGVGVAFDLNSKKPKDFKNSNPLSLSSEYWDSWNSYIFAKIEGEVDKTGNGAYGDAGDKFFLYHTGTDGQYVEDTIWHSFKLDDNMTENLDLNLDVSKLFYNTSDTLDLSVGEFIHQGNPNSSDYAKTLFIMRNFPNALSK